MTLSSISRADSSQLFFFGDDWASVKNITHGIWDSQINKAKEFLQQLKDLQKKSR